MGRAPSWTLATLIISRFRQTCVYNEMDLEPGETFIIYHFQTSIFPSVRWDNSSENTSLLELLRSSGERALRMIKAAAELACSSRDLDVLPLEGRICQSTKVFSSLGVLRDGL